MVMRLIAIVSPRFVYLYLHSIYSCYHIVSIAFQNGLYGAGEFVECSTEVAMEAKRWIDFVAYTMNKRSYELARAFRDDFQNITCSY